MEKKKRRSIPLVNGDRKSAAPDFISQSSRFNPNCNLHAVEKILIPTVAKGSLFIASYAERNDRWRVSTCTSQGIASDIHFLHRAAGTGLARDVGAPRIPRRWDGTLLQGPQQKASSVLPYSFVLQNSACFVWMDTHKKKNDNNSWNLAQEPHDLKGLEVWWKN